MSAGFDYTNNAIRFVNRFPVLNYVLIQINFWVIAYIFLGIIANLILLTSGPALHAETNLAAILFIAFFFGLATGIVSGISDKILERRLFYNRSLGIIILIKAIINFIVFVVLISLVRYIAYPYLQKTFFHNANTATIDKSWDAFFQLLFLYNLVTGLVISFINQVNKKFGPGVLVPLLLGKYRKPREEERIFLFMDLKASTTLAESLGHLKYSSFIRDSFMDINSVLAAYNAQVYQYVGDEIVVTWTKNEGLKRQSCIEFFFACIERFTKRSDHYLKNYGQIPHFKAGLHMGMVTAVEVGEIKRDIAYHGDTLNTAARIQSVCNDYNQQLLASMELLKSVNADQSYLIDSLGMIALKGKIQAVEIAGVKKRL